MNSEEVMSVDVAIYLGLCVLMTLCLCGQYRLQLLFMLRLKSRFSHIPPQCPSKSQMLAWGAVLLFADISNFAYYLFIAHYLVAVSYEAAVNFLCTCSANREFLRFHVGRTCGILRLSTVI